MPQTARKTTEKLHEWRPTTTHTHTALRMSEFWCQVHLFPLFFSPSFTVLFFPLFPACSSPLFFSLSHFLSLSLQPQTGNICSIFRQPVSRPHAWAELKNVWRGRNNPNFPPLLRHSILRPFISFQEKKQVLYFTVCPPRLFSLCHTHTFRATLPLYLTLLAV